MSTERQELCSDIGKPEITNINDCKEANFWLGENLDKIGQGEFVDLTNDPDPTVPRGCFRIVEGEEMMMLWNPVDEGSTHESTHAICLKYGKYILVHFSPSTSELIITHYIIYLDNSTAYFILQASP